MLMKTCNTLLMKDFTHKQRFKTLTRDNLVGVPFSAINEVGRPCAFAHFAHS